MKSKIFLILIIGLIFNSCFEEINLNDKMIGIWMIEGIYKNNIDIKDSINYNMLFFEKNDLLQLPETNNYKQHNADWKIKEDDNTLQIISKNKIFNGNYSIRFIKNDEKKLLGAIFENNDKRIIAYKFQLDYYLDGYDWNKQFLDLKPAKDCQDGECGDKK